MSGSLVPVAIAAAVVQASIYDVPGGYRAVMFDRFSGVRNTVRTLLYMRVFLLIAHTHQASLEGTHFLVPWLQKAILYDCRIKPRVSQAPISLRIS